jgi:hypothetical protein
MTKRRKTRSFRWHNRKCKECGKKYKSTEKYDQKCDCCKGICGHEEHKHNKK